MTIHQLGKTLDRDNVNFEVGLKPVLHLVGNKVHEAEGFFLPYNKDTHDIYGVVKSRYKVQQHTENLLSLTKIINTVSQDYEVQHTLQGNKVISVFTLNSHSIMARVKNEEARPQIVSTHDYSGHVAFCLNIAIVRLICSNGQMILDKSLEIIKKRHFQSLNPSVIINKLPFYLTRYINTYTGFYKKARDLNPIHTAPLRDDKRFPDKLLETIRDTFKGSKDKSMWGQYNAFTHVITREEKANEDTKQLHLRLTASLFMNALVNK